MPRMTMSMAAIVATVLLLAMSVTQAKQKPTGCPCAKHDLCLPAEPSHPVPEVYVFSRQSTNVHLWRWSTIHTLVVPPSFDKGDLMQAETMCLTHGKGKKFGVTVELDLKTAEKPGTFNTDESKKLLEEWRLLAMLKQKSWYADVLTIDLLPFFHADTSSRREDLRYLAKVLFDLSQDLMKTEILCIVPWKPPCAKQDGSCDFTLWARDACTYFVLSSDSFLDKSDSKCAARANIPFSKLIYGISEYNAHHIALNRLILGVMWHGYDYTCTSLDNDVCGLERPVTNDSDTTQHICDFSQRKRVTYGDIVRDHSVEYANHKQDKLYNAPYFRYKNRSVPHQVWFEDKESLKAKYRLVHELGLKGIGIMYGDDLSPTAIPNLLNNEGLMWSWVSHEVLLTSTKAPEHHDLHWADTVAGVAVGCFLLGVVLGVVFTCIGTQKRIKKPHRPPFRADMDPLGNDYTDDPDL